MVLVLQLILFIILINFWMFIKSLYRVSLVITNDNIKTWYTPPVSWQFSGE